MISSTVTKEKRKQQPSNKQSTMLPGSFASKDPTIGTSVIKFKFSLLSSQPYTKYTVGWNFMSSVCVTEKNKDNKGILLGTCSEKKNTLGLHQSNNSNNILD